MRHKYLINLISDSTEEVLKIIFHALKSQFSSFNYEKKEFFFARSKQQINKIIKEIKIPNYLNLDFSQKQIEELKRFFKYK
jgi:regulator of PEP synthase PpsR (kinase-PPPase family)